MVSIEVHTMNIEFVVSYSLPNSVGYESDHVCRSDAEAEEERLKKSYFTILLNR